jgi:hypothetical protein
MSIDSGNRQPSVRRRVVRPHLSSDAYISTAHVGDLCVDRNIIPFGVDFFISLNRELENVRFIVDVGDLRSGRRAKSAQDQKTATRNLRHKQRTFVFPQRSLT